MILRFFRIRSAHGLALAAVSAFPLIAAAQGVPHFPTPGTDPARPATTVPALPQSPAISPDGSVVEEVIARVNDQIISRSDMERSQQQLQQELAQQPSPDGEERVKNLLRDLIDKQLLLSKGKDLGINADADVVKQLDEIRKQNHLDTMEDLEKAARSQGVSFEDFKASIRNNIITSSVVRDEVSRHISMTTADETKYYNAHQDQFAQPEQVRLSEILVPAGVDSTEAALAEALKKAEAIEASLKGGASFADTAKKLSGGPTASSGGDLGYFKHGGLAPVLEDATFKLKAGEFTAPIRTRQGYVILQVADHQQAGVPPLSQVEDQVREAMYSEQMAPALRAYLTRLREEAYIDIKPGFVDTGASGKETKPVFSAYAPPAPKKKVAPAKGRFDSNRKGANAAVAAAPQQVATVQLKKNGKPKRVKREKIRYGQAPRVALPPALGDETAVAPVAVAPGTAIAPNETNNTVAVNDDPLAPQAPEKKKTRFAAHAVEVKQKKVETVQRKVAEKAAATPEAASTQEQQAKKVQSAPLGLSGDTAKKKKPKRKKGDPKDRLQNKEPEKAAPLVQNPMPDKKTGLPPAPPPPSAPAPAPAPTQP